jgi:SET domain-containing protein
VKRRKPKHRVTNIFNGSIAKPSPEPTVGPVNEWVEVRKSPIQGYGVFARKEIPRGTRIIEYAGERITNAVGDRRYPDDESQRHHTFLFVLNNRVMIDAAYDGNEARLINHSCDPNCQANHGGGEIWIDAIKRIPAGEELAYDYEYEDDKAYTEADLLYYGCRCGSANCRGTIVDTKRLLKKKSA